MPKLVVLLLLVSSVQRHPALGASPVSLYKPNRFHRLDPLSGFQFYDGGYDLRSKHYWASAAFTGVHGFAMAGLWTFGGFILLASFLIWEKKNVVAMSSSVSNGEIPHSRSRLPLLLAIILLTLLVLAVSCIALVATHEFHTNAKKLENILLGAAQATLRAIHRVVKATRAVYGLLCSYDEVICALVTSALEEVRTESKAIHRMIRDTEGLVDTIIQVSYSTTLGIICLTLIVVAGKLVALLMNWKSGLIMIICICWLLTSTCWLLCGLHFFWHIVIEDTCLELDMYRREPSTSALTSIIPCPNGTAADFLMADLDFKVRGPTVEVNFNITRLLNITGPENHHEEAEQFLTRCDASSSTPSRTHNQKACSNASIGHDRTRRSYAMVLENTKPIRSFVGAFSDIERLLHCSYLRDALEDVLAQQCAPLQYWIWLLWSTMFSFSITLVVLEVAWVAVALERRIRKLSCSTV